MPPNPIVVVHGWSDRAKSFKRLAKLIRSGLGRPVRRIDLADWISLNDDVTFADLREGMQRAWKAKRLPTSPRSVDIVVHSTGALVTRDWMTTYFTPRNCPIHRLVMLAPANYGSSLAHKGRAFIGRIIKGWATGLETGTHILRGLELASPYTWELAERDVFARGNERWYGNGRTLVTVFVGNKGYSGIKAAANEDGGDGTVRISTANLNSVKYRLSFSDSKVPSFRASLPQADAAAGFAIMDTENHGTIIGKRRRTPKKPVTLDFILDALSVRSAGWDRWRNRLDDHTKKVAQRMKDSGESSLNLFQNTVVRVVDDLGQPVHDYFVEFDLNVVDKDPPGTFFHRDVIHTVHTNSEDSSYRAFYINDTKLKNKVNQPHESLRISLSALPKFEKKAVVGYSTKHDGGVGTISLDYRQIRRLFLPNRTVLLEIVIERKLSENVFTIESAPAP